MLRVEWLGSVPYAEALEVQEKRLEARRRGAAPDSLLLLEHPPVVTLGRGARPEHVLMTPAALAERGIALHAVARGGDVTYHGPGQLVGYLIADLAAGGSPDVTAFLRRIERVLCDALAELGVNGTTRPGWTGVFATGATRPPRQDDHLEHPPQGAAGAAQRSEAERSSSGRAAAQRPRKIASIGIGVRGWVSWHGFALNVSLDPAAFAPIVPCGLREIVMTSVAAELGTARPPDLDLRARDAVARCFERDFALAAPGALR